ncbi:endonuclease [Treponema phagedenis]|uniref:Endonuclease n=3 Tax=Treponema phagedenis TaxID=162 RepID=A0AAE6IW04_TREPH|nr:endonuclease [Treponema phagedenis]QEK03758.1 endonuclease [Treponema phagedenis]QEK09373.1 endonuclease [Treponema phagedenis]
MIKRRAMMRIKRIRALVSIAALAVFLFFIPISCIGCSTVFGFSSWESPKTLSLVSYNTQTFFDAIEDGQEFNGFKGSKSRWSPERYKVRLNRLREALMIATEALTGDINSLPDILILQEIEGERVINDFCRQLSRKENYNYAVITPIEKNAAFTTALLSKLPILDVFIHRLHTEKESVRPLCEVWINIGSEEYPEPLVVFSTHWKSKLGKNTAEIRRMQEKQVFQKIQELKKTNPDIHYVICGDFNQPLEEFDLLTELPNSWNRCEYLRALSVNAQPGGSFCYKGNWQAIDHIFYSENLSDNKGLDIEHFAVIAIPPLITSAGKPNAYSVFSGKGYSDHLPIGVRLKKYNSEE